MIISNDYFERYTEVIKLSNAIIELNFFKRYILKTRKWELVILNEISSFQIFKLLNSTHLKTRIFMFKMKNIENQM